MASSDRDSEPFPLHRAAGDGRGKSLNSPAQDLPIITSPSLIAVVHCLPVAAVEALLKSDPRAAGKRDDDGRFPIHWAASSNHLEIVNLLANQKSFDPDVQDASGWTPLMIAASVPNGEPILRLLLQKDADVNMTNNSGQSALHFVASKKSLDTAHLLLENKASTRIRDKRGQYPIHRAAAIGSVPMVALLLKKGSPLNAQDHEGYTPLHHAVAEGRGDTAVALLKEEADFTLKTNQDELALDLAPDKEVCKFIIHGAEREGISLDISLE